VELVADGIGMDKRIGRDFLNAGLGYGGSCFPKDVKALLASAAGVGEPLHVLSAVERANERQKHVLVDRIVGRFGADLSGKRFAESLEGKRFALWGLAFKPDTDDLREAPSCVIVRALAERGATVVAHDPEAMDAAREALADVASLEFAPTPMAALEGADALVIVTEWKAYRSPDFERVRTALREPVVIDGRNLFDPVLVREAGIEYHPIGRSALSSAQAPLALAA
jgi:UDPglucose 6-dehydrogenase